MKAEPPPPSHSFLMDTTVQRAAFGLGHVLNDLTACGWFSFYLVFLTHVLMISDVEAGLLLFIGQIADALATPVVGILSDRLTHGSPRGRKLSLALGSVMVGLSYPLMYAQCPFKTGPHHAANLFWFLAAIIVVFQFGWAAAQISHLALLTDIGTTSYVRTILNSIRFCATVSANLAVFLAAFIVLSNGDQDITPEDAPSFRHLAYIVTAFGALCSIGCLSVVHIPTKHVGAHDQHATHARLEWWHWFLRLDFWQAGMLYMCARLIANLVQVYLQLYVVEALRMPPLALALVPSTFFAGQMAASSAIPYLNARFATETIFVAGLVSVSAGSALSYIAYIWTENAVYAGGLILGVGCGITMVMSLAVVADLVSKQQQTAAWVYGLMSFSDKISNGLALLLVQRGLENLGSFQAAAAGRRRYLLEIITLLPTGIAILALLTVASIVKCRKVRAADPEAKPLLPRAPSPEPGCRLMTPLADMMLTSPMMYHFGWAHWDLDTGDEWDMSMFAATP